jgi:hypothetical protein
MRSNRAKHDDGNGTAFGVALGALFPGFAGVREVAEAALAYAGGALPNLTNRLH